MKVKYLSDTDTAHVEFKDNYIHETKERRLWPENGQSDQKRNYAILA